MTEACGTWVYAVLDAAGPLPTALPAPGVGGEPLRTVTAAGLTAVVSSVDLAGLAATDTAEDRDRVERIARAHHAVLLALAGTVPLVPFRLGTIFQNDSGVAGMLVHRHTFLAEALTMVTGCTEWGVKATLRATAAQPPDTRDELRPGIGSGTAYLLRRRTAHRRVERVHRLAGQCAEVVHASLAGYARAARRHPVHDPGCGTILNASYLVPDVRSVEFRHTIALLQCDHAGLELQLTGPWPPYCAGVDSGQER